ncbi:hypothetical protein Efla_007661 [Eimeria flavescens]
MFAARKQHAPPTASKQAGSQQHESLASSTCSSKGADGFWEIAADQRRKARGALPSSPSPRASRAGAPRLDSFTYSAMKTGGGASASRPCGGGKRPLKSEQHSHLRQPREPPRASHQEKLSSLLVVESFGGSAEASRAKGRKGRRASESKAGMLLSTSSASTGLLSSGPEAAGAPAEGAQRRPFFSPVGATDAAETPDRLNEASPGVSGRDLSRQGSLVSTFPQRGQDACPKSGREGLQAAAGPSKRIARPFSGQEPLRIARGPPSAQCRVLPRQRPLAGVYRQRAGAPPLQTEGSGAASSSEDFVAMGKGVLSRRCSAADILGAPSKPLQAGPTYRREASWSHPLHRHHALLRPYDAAHAVGSPFRGSRGSRAATGRTPPCWTHLTTQSISAVATGAARAAAAAAAAAAADAAAAVARRTRSPAAAAIAAVAAAAATQTPESPAATPNRAFAHRQQTGAQPQLEGLSEQPAAPEAANHSAAVAEAAAAEPVEASPTPATKRSPCASPRPCVLSKSQVHAAASLSAPPATPAAAAAAAVAVESVGVSNGITSVPAVKAPQVRLDGTSSTDAPATGGGEAATMDTEAAAVRNAAMAKGIAVEALLAAEGRGAVATGATAAGEAEAAHPVKGAAASETEAESQAASAKPEGAEAAATAEGAASAAAAAAGGPPASLQACSCSCGLPGCAVCPRPHCSPYQNPCPISSNSSNSDVSSGSIEKREYLWGPVMRPPRKPWKLFDAQQPLRLKVVTFGPPGSGKSCLVRRFCERRFAGGGPPGEGPFLGGPRTIALDFGVRDVLLETGETVRLHFVDLSGAPEFEEAGEGALRGGDVLLGVFNAAEPTTLQPTLRRLLEAKQQAGGYSPASPAAAMLQRARPCGKLTGSCGHSAGCTHRGVTQHTEKVCCFFRCVLLLKLMPANAFLYAEPASSWQLPAAPSVCTAKLKMEHWWWKKKSCFEASTEFAAPVTAVSRVFLSASVCLSAAAPRLAECVKPLASKTTAKSPYRADAACLSRIRVPAQSTLLALSLWLLDVWLLQVAAHCWRWSLQKLKELQQQPQQKLQQQPQQQQASCSTLHARRQQKEWMLSSWKQQQRRQPESEPAVHWPSLPDRGP